MTQLKIKILKNHFEKKSWAEGFYTCGLDEVGRGCLAGPLVVAAVIIPPNTSYRLLKDSKILSQDERNKAFDWITKHCSWSVGIVSHRMIDSINIYQATLYAMKKAYLGLMETLPFPREQLKYVVIDAMPLDLDEMYGHKDLEFYHFNKGESLSSSIAAASIVAKVTRDNLMSQLIGPHFPAFGFDQHKGYATKQHIAALLEQGPTIIHRSSFIGGIMAGNDINQSLQKNLFEDNEPS